MRSLNPTAIFLAAWYFVTWLALAPLVAYVLRHAGAPTWSTVSAYILLYGAPPCALAGCFIVTESRRR